MRSVKGLYFVLIFVLILSVWLARTQLAGFGLTYFMQSSGLIDITADIHHLGLNQSQLSKLKFSLQNETSLLRLEAHDISLSYNPDQLKQGRVGSVTIKNLVLGYETKPDIKPEPSSHSPAIQQALEPLKTIAALRRALREYIVFNSLIVEHIILLGDEFSVLEARPLKFNSRNDNGVLYAVLSILNGPSASQNKNVRQLVITMPVEDSLEIKLGFSEAAEAAAKLELNIKDEKITGQYHFNPAPLQHWLQAAVDIPASASKVINELSSINGSFIFNLESNKQIISTITANTDKLDFKSFSAEKIAVKLITSNAVSNPWHITKVVNGSYIKTRKMSYGDIALDGNPVNIQGELTKSADNWKYKGENSLELFAITYHKQVLQIKDITLAINASPDYLKADGYFSTAGLPAQFTFSLDNNLIKQQGRLSVTSVEPIEFNVNDNKLSQLFNLWPYPFDLLVGNINLATYATWSKKDDFKLNTHIQFDNVGGSFNELLFSGLSFNHELNVLPEIYSVNAGKINLKSLESGVTVSNISTNISLKSANSESLPWFSIQNLQGDILGGRFSVDDFIFDLNKPENSFKVMVNDIDLEKIVETQQFEDIMATGKLDGSFPVKITEKGISIVGGAFNDGVHTGIIQYNPVAGADQMRQNPLTGIALDALRDFRYSYLAADVNFTPEGKLTVKLQLKGTSPELDTDRPVHLNISTEQNLYALLKSLRFAESVDESIDDRVRRQYEKNESKN